MWMLSFVPDAWLHLAVLGILAIGVMVYVLSYFVSFVPTLIPAREPIRIAGTLLIVAGVYFYGSYATEMSWRQRVEAVEAKVTIAEKQSRLANDRLVQVRKQKNRVLVDRQLVFKDRIQTIEKRIDAECRVDPEVIRILNDAATNPEVKK